MANLQYDGIIPQEKVLSWSFYVLIPKGLNMRDNWESVLIKKELEGSDHSAHRSSFGESSASGRAWFHPWKVLRHRDWNSWGDMLLLFSALETSPPPSSSPVSVTFLNNNLKHANIGSLQDCFPCQGCNGYCIGPRALLKWGKTGLSPFVSDRLPPARRSWQHNCVWWHFMPESTHNFWQVHAPEMAPSTVHKSIHLLCWLQTDGQVRFCCVLKGCN